MYSHAEVVRLFYQIKERETHPNFNILTDRAPTPDFSITYIETSCNTDDESGLYIFIPAKTFCFSWKLRVGMFQ